MRGGMAPQAACREACEHIARLRGDAIRGLQVGFLALGKDGAVGAFALVPGSNYAVTRASGAAEVLPAGSLFVDGHIAAIPESGRAHVSTLITNESLVCRVLF